MRDFPMLGLDPKSGLPSKQRYLGLMGPRSSYFFAANPLSEASRPQADVSPSIHNHRLFV